MKTATIEKTEKRKYVIQFPESYPLTKEKLQELIYKNPNYEMEANVNNSIVITESTFLLEDYGTFGVKVPGFTAGMFEELHELNEEINFEFEDNEEVFIKMGVFRLISKLTGAIFASIYNWATSGNSGDVYGESGEYEVENPQSKGKKIRRIPDVSYISYQTASAEEQNSWDSFIPIPPNLVVEIISAKYGLKGDLKKMEEVWMATGVDVGIVICPFSEMIYIFEKGSTGYRSQSIYENFSHPLLPGYSENYGKFLKKGK